MCVCVCVRVRVRVRVREPVKCASEREMGRDFRLIFKISLALTAPDTHLARRQTHSTHTHTQKDTQNFRGDQRGVRRSSSHSLHLQII